MDSYIKNEEYVLRERLFKLLYEKQEADPEAAGRTRERWNKLGKPLYSLGVLEENIVKMGAVQKTHKVKLDKTAIVVLCADHGVVREGVSQTDSSVTRTVAENIASGAGCVNIMAACSDSSVYVIDIGMDCPEYHENRIIMLPSRCSADVINRKVARGTGDIAIEPAMTKTQCLKAILEGIEIVKELYGRGYQIIGTGEMGIGNTTPSSALASVLLNIPSDEVTGPGAGLSMEGLKRKIEVVDQAIDRYWKTTENTRIPEDVDFNKKIALELLSQLGGLEIAGMTGICLGGQIYGVTIMLDGLISTVSALCAQLMSDGVTSYLLASHVGAEPACKKILKQLGLKPVIDASLAQGEGTGAAAGINMMRMAHSVYKNLKTFEQLKVDQYEDFTINP